MIYKVTDTDDFYNQLAGLPMDCVVLVNFRTNWAGPCKEVARHLEETGEAMTGVVVVEVDAEDCGDLAGQFQISAMPSVLVFRKSELKSRLCGKIEIAEKLEEAVQEA